MPGVLRIQSSLTEDQMKRLRAEAKRRGISVAAILCDALEARVRVGEWETRKRRALEVVGAYRLSHTDVGVNHDLYLDP
jgi:hypothetical protein